MSFPSPDGLHEIFAQAFAARDVEALLGLYESDAIRLQRDGQILRGVDALRSVFEGLVKADLKMEGVQQPPLIADDLALTSTRYEYESDGADGDRVTIRMVTAEVSRRQSDGSWRIVIDAPSFA